MMAVEAINNALNDLARGCVNIQCIEQHWDDMLRVAGSLKLGTIHASELIRTLLRSERPLLLGINRSSYYLKPEEEKKYNLELMKRIDREYLLHPFYGSRRMTAVLKNEGHAVGVAPIKTDH